MTDQYMIKLYHISVDKQSGTVQYQDLNTVLSYDEFYDYFKKVKTERSTNNRALSDAIRKRAGLGDVENKIPSGRKLSRYKLNQMYKRFSALANMTTAEINRNLS